METKQRSHIFDRGVYTSFITDEDGNIILKTDGEFIFEGHQKILTEGHRWPYSRRRDSHLDIGGGFQSSKTSGYGGSTIRVATSAPGTHGSRREYIGNFYPMWYESPWWIKSSEFITPPSHGSMVVDGTTHIARADPTRSQNSAVVSASEIVRDGLPIIGSLTNRVNGWRQSFERIATLYSRARTSPARVASELFLEYQFAFAPLVRDIRQFYETTSSLDKRIAQLQRDNDRVVRRRYNESPAESTVDHGSQYPSYGAPPLDYYLYAAPGTLHTKVRFKTTKVFSGAFQYHIPFNRDGSRESHIAQGRALGRILYGADLNVSSLYQATPWSWALDWISNVGDTLANVVSAQENGLVMKYGYEQQHQLIDVDYTLTDVQFQWPPGPHTFDQTMRQETKSRIRATPFGFGLNIDLFTTRQWALIAALGISRTPRNVNI